MVVCVCAHVRVPACVSDVALCMRVQCLERLEEGDGHSEAEVTDGYEPASVSTGNQTWVCCASRMYCSQKASDCQGEN